MLTVIQFTRYALVGLAVNLALYMLYLLVTELGMGHKTAMTALYVLGVLLTFTFNRNWSFSHDGQIPATLVRYIVAYSSGYLINLVLLFSLVDVRGLPHQWVQGVMIFSLAVYLFLLQKFWVFKDSKTS
jgi:putative flippase GtrA